MRIVLLLSIVATSLLSCNSSKKDILETHTYTNNLIHETSPYLLQHAHNPVDWNAWNSETLAKSKKEGKLMVISIGYAACHWCHVMEHESFEDSTVAAVMNKHFVSVKVDREERPDVDQIYINAVQLMTGSAGWPLNVITLPDGRPIWGGTYFKKEDWIQGLTKIQKLYETEPEKLEEYASLLEDGIKSMDLVALNTEDVDFKKFDTKALLKNWEQNFDKELGGYSQAPKFMMPNNYEYLLREAIQNNDANLLKYVNVTLTNMAYGGIYDHIGGGFARYSVDEKWHIPHFEKMLYDNAQLVSLYSNAFAVTGKELYKEVVFESLEYIQREMTNNDGAFYSSLDADSKNAAGKLVEGAYYIYSKEELQKLLKADFDIFKEYYNINNYGLWEDGNYVLIRNKDDASIEKEFAITHDQLIQKKKYWKETLLTHRNKRPKTRLDDKTLTSWNGLMISGYIDAFKVFGKQEYLDAALKNANFIATKQLQKNGALFHSYKDGKSTINGYLEDYSAVIQAYISLYQVTLDEKWLNLSKQLAEYSFKNFFDEEKSMFYFTSKEDEKLVTRNFEYRDNVIPASNSIMANNLFLLSHYYDVPKYEETAHQMLRNVLEEMEKYPSGFSNWLNLLANYKEKFYEVVVVGPEASQKIKEINAAYIPNKLVAGSKKENNAYLLEGRFVPSETFIYVCVNNTCKLPVRTTTEALRLINNDKK